MRHVKRLWNVFTGASLDTSAGLKSAADFWTTLQASYGQRSGAFFPLRGGSCILRSSARLHAFSLPHFRASIARLRRLSPRTRYLHVPVLP